MCSKATFKSKSPMLYRLRQAIRSDHKSIHTEDAYTHWATEFVWWSNMQNPEAMGDAEVGAFLSYLAQSGYSVSSCKQALNALVYLYTRVLSRPLGRLAFEKSKRPVNAPDWLTPEEVRAVMDHLSGNFLLFCRMLYGTGMRLQEGLQLRIKDVDFQAGKITLRDTKSDRDRVVPLPKSLAHELSNKIMQTKQQHAADLKAGCGSVWLPGRMAEKNPSSAKSVQWQYVFPSRTLCKDPRSGVTRRHHLFATGIQQALTLAARKAGITKRVSPHVLRHSYATALLQARETITTVQQLLGHKDVSTTMIYLHCLDNSKVVSPLDAL